MKLANNGCEHHLWLVDVDAMMGIAVVAYADVPASGTRAARCFRLKKQNGYSFSRFDDDINFENNLNDQNNNSKLKKQMITREAAVRIAVVLGLRYHRCPIKATRNYS